MSVLEYNFWVFYRQKFGFKADRIEWTTANGLAALVQSWGGSVTASDIIAQFGPRRQASKKKLVHDLAALPGAKVKFIPTDAGKPALEGAAALEELDRIDDAPERKRGKTLDGKDRPEKPRRTKTLDGG